MKISNIGLLLLLAFLLLFSCQPKGVVKNDQAAQVDSSFYYVQEDINDPFIDTVFQDPDKSITLTKNLYPPPAVKPKFKEVEGFRVQIFAGLDTINADAIYTQTRDMVTDSVYLFKDQGLFKIQVGDYQFRYEADNMRDSFRTSGNNGAWVIQRTINIPIAADSTQIADTPQLNEAVPVVVAQPAPQAVKKTDDTGQYKIQIIATGSEDRAQSIVGEITESTAYSAFYEKSGNLFKVFVGYFKQEAIARDALNEVREKGFPDAWLVY
jgi:hypothetical protein